MCYRGFSDKFRPRRLIPFLPVLHAAVQLWDQYCNLPAMKLEDTCTCYMYNLPSVFAPGDREHQLKGGLAH